MAVKIRLQRFGAKKRPYYRIVAADSRYPRDGRYLEQVGTYNPMLETGGVTLVQDRFDYWCLLVHNLHPLLRVSCDV